jgi:hypothetical protein
MAGEVWGGIYSVQMNGIQLNATRAKSKPSNAMKPLRNVRK